MGLVSRGQSPVVSSTLGDGRLVCYKPRTAYRPKEPGAPLVFSPREGWEDRPVQVPCGNCIGCRLDYSRQWAVRMMHEAQMYEHNCFITLTYNKENLPANGSLDIRHFQLFMKKFRKSIEPKRIRFFHCGEYGDPNEDEVNGFGRPHYHAIIFNHDFADKEYFFTNKNGNRVYKSAELLKLWKKGHVTTADVSWQSCAYVARYCMKKMNGEKAEAHYLIVNWETGEIGVEDDGVCWFRRLPEYATMSDGIGRAWYEAYGRDAFVKDFLTIDGRKMKAPRYYDRLRKEEMLPSQVSLYNEPNLSAKLKGSRMTRARCSPDETPERRRVREKVKLDQVKRLSRRMEDE